MHLYVSENVNSEQKPLEVFISGSTCTKLNLSLCADRVDYRIRDTKPYQLVLLRRLKY
nr:MAG TPA: hypothetical protein [Caudoviricetes sp.]